jgi:hypothetical protein
MLSHDPGIQARPLRPEANSRRMGVEAMLLLAMIVLGLAAFAAMLGFIRFCDRV